MAKKRYQDLLRTPKNAYFFRKLKLLSRSHVKRIFDSAMKHATDRALQARPINEHVQIGNKTVRYSFLLFREKHEPAFLDASQLKNVVHCYLLICELPDTIVVFKSHAHFLESDLEDAGAPIEHSELTRMYMDDDATYERIAMRMMNLSREGIHSSTQAALDLARAMSTAGANRAIPTGLQIKSEDGTHTVIPNTGRIGQRDVRCPLNTLLAWALAVEEELARPKPATGFIDHFAGAVKLGALPAGVEPRGIIFPLISLTDGLDDGTYLQILKKTALGQFQPVDQNDFAKIIEIARHPFEIEQDGGGKHWLVRPPHRRIGELKLNKNSITVAARLLSRFYVEKPNHERSPLSTVINQAKDFLVSFSDPRYAYHGGLYRDHNLLNQIDAFMSVFHAVPQLAACTSEKGHTTLTENTRQFPTNSVFGVVCNNIAANDTFLLCDDLGDEWADAIGVCTTPADRCISFYVAKHESVGLSASHFQEAIGQAMKNLSHKHPLPAEIQAKMVKWGERYSLNGVNTRIQRLLKGPSVSAAAAAIEAELACPISRFRMCLVVSFISKMQLQNALAQLRQNQAGPAQLVQLLWFVTGFVSSCRYASVVPYIYCRP